MTDLHKLAFEDALGEIRRLEGEIEAAKAVARYHQARIGTARPKEITPAKTPISPAPGVNISLGDDGGDSEDSGPYAGMTKHEVAEHILREKGRSMGAAQIAKAAQQTGYRPNLDFRILLNAFYVSMKRKPETFKNIDRKWSLVEWDAKGAADEHKE